METQAQSILDDLEVCDYIMDEEDDSITYYDKENLDEYKSKEIAFIRIPADFELYHIPKDNNSTNKDYQADYKWYVYHDASNEQWVLDDNLLNSETYHELDDFFDALSLEVCQIAIIKINETYSIGEEYFYTDGNNIIRDVNTN